MQCSAIAHVVDLKSIHQRPELCGKPAYNLVTETRGSRNLTSLIRDLQVFILESAIVMERINHIVAAL